MNWLMAVVPLVPAFLLVAVGLAPLSGAKHNTGLARKMVTYASQLTLFVAVLSAGLLALTRPALWSVSWPAASSISLGVYFDSLSAVMYLLVSFIGYVILRYSVNYLDGDSTQDRFMQRLSLTLGSVLFLVISSNLLMFFAAWVMTSFGLHRLLNHYSRPAAVLAARKKFLISRLGDLLLVAALVLTYRLFGSFEYEVLFREASKMGASSADGWQLLGVGILFVMGAMTKSAQVPFHSWLPDTMETPTPVSAFMHAGVINAGGFLVIRLSPLLSQSHIALDLLALIGAVTALFGSVVMLTQTSIKRSLAFSTIAQMGLMMLQCGLGAFSAALLHIVAHSLYKAYAFLSSGSVLEIAARSQWEVPRNDWRKTIQGLAASLAISVTLVAGLLFILSLVSSHKAGMLPLAIILILSLTQTLWNSFAFDQPRVVYRGIGTACLVSCGYAIAWFVMDQILAKSVSQVVIDPSWFDQAVLAVVIAGFVAVFALQAAVQYRRGSLLLRRLYVHASNGFYLDVAAHKLTTRLWGLASRT